jgi:outer membrane murein-binding lipoprotein Lpp
MLEKYLKRASPLALAVGVALLTAPVAYAAESGDALVDRIDAMERELQTLKGDLAKAKQDAQAAKKDAAAAKKEAYTPDTRLSKWHLAGYADALFKVTDEQGVDNTFVFGHFNPIVHFQFADKFLFEGELEFQIGEDGSTTTALEYAAIDYLVTDYATIVAGAFLSPIGQFQERLHPTWVNKLPDAPPGFGHGGIQPLSDLGLQVRGGVPVGSMTANYAIYAGNGPRMGHHGPELEAFGSDDNDNKAVGGRFGLIPMPHLEVGGSFMFAEALGESATSGSVTEADFDLWGADISYTDGPWDVRVEYLNVETSSFLGGAEDGAADTSLIEATDWEAWYLQAAYQFSGFTNAPVLKNFEAVLRYGDFTVKGFEEFAEASEERWSAGLNYLFAPSIILKTAVSLTDFDEDGTEDKGEFLMQLAYGF